jgi:hypothetical protein
VPESEAVLLDSSDGALGSDEEELFEQPENKTAAARNRAGIHFLYIFLPLFRL